MRLTKNFSLEEFACKDGSETPQEIIYSLQKLANQLQVLRNYVGRPVTINSGYRTPEYNATLKGSVKGSQHTLGRAADIVVEGFTPKQVSDIIEDLICRGDMLQGGLGTYSTFVHYDIGYNGKKRRW